MAYDQFRRPWEDDLGFIIDTNGDRLFEDEYGGLLDEIILLNDGVTLNCYINQRSRRGVLHEGEETAGYDPFWLAAAHGSTDALRILLDLYEADPSRTKPLEDRGFSILNTACLHGQLETAKFLLDRDPPFGAAYAEDHDGGLALWCAACAIVDTPSFEKKHSDDLEKNLLHKHVTNCENLICLLVERGASLHTSQQRNEGFLGQAVSRASYDLITLLIREGVDIHERKDSYRGNSVSQNVTALHIASGYCNVAGVQALLDNYRNSEKQEDTDMSLEEMVSVRDGTERLPIHWTARSPYIDSESIFSEEEISSRTINTFKLLLEHNPDSVNARDKWSWTALHHVARTHRTCGNKSHFENIIRFLCENGADASLSSDGGKTILHELAYHYNPIKPAIFDILMDHGAKNIINQADKDGNTALHQMAGNLWQLESVKILLRYGADIHITNLNGETPLHKAAIGSLVPQVEMDEWGSKNINPTYMDHVRAQDEMIAVLQEAAGISAMDVPNGEGKTPLQLQEETKIEWRRREEWNRNLIRGRGPGCENILEWNEEIKVF